MAGDGFQFKVPLRLMQAASVLVEQKEFQTFTTWIGGMVEETEKGVIGLEALQALAAILEGLTRELAGFTFRIAMQHAGPDVQRRNGS